MYIGLPSLLSAQVSLGAGLDLGPCLYNNSKEELAPISTSYALGLTLDIHSHTLEYKVRREILNRKIEGFEYISKAFYHQATIGRRFPLQGGQSIDLGFLVGISFLHEIKGKYHQSSPFVTYTSGKFGINGGVNFPINSKLMVQPGFIYGVQESFFMPPAHHLYHSLIFKLGLEYQFLQKPRRSKKTNYVP